MSQEKDLEKKFFDNFAATKKDYDVFDDHGYQTLIDKFREWVRPRPGELLLDLGSGTGAFARRLSPLGLKVGLVDISTKCLRLAGEIHPGCFQLAADIERLPLRDAAVDIISYSAVLHHFIDFNHALREGYRVLKPGGRLFAYDPHQKNPFMWLYRSPESPLHSEVGRTPNERLLTVEELRKGLEAAGFGGCVSVEAVNGVTFKYVESWLVRGFLCFYNFQERLFKASGLAEKYGSFVLAVAEK